MIARPETSNGSRTEDPDPIQAWFENTVIEQEEPQPATPPCPFGLGLLSIELPPTESVGYKVAEGGGDTAPPRF
eukprot:11222854-Lingulodinium_polyedra.AAC.1